MLRVTNDKHSIDIPTDDLVTVTRMHHIVEVQHMEKINTTNHIKKLDKDRYVDLKTGEIKEFAHIENRSESINSLRQTFKKLRYLINNNFIGGGNELHVTLTYSDNMTDVNKLYNDFRKFMQRLKYQYNNISTIDYISVIEPQARGAWHSHLLLRFNDIKKIYIDNDKMRQLWGHGFVTVKSLKEVDNIGAYLSAYLSDIELTNETFADLIYINNGQATIRGSGIKEINGKRYIKGGRLHLYPAGMNLYRKSKGIIYPKRQRVKYGDIKKIVGCAEPHYSKKIEVNDVDNDFKNTITYVQYNLKRLEN